MQVCPTVQSSRHIMLSLHRVLFVVTVLLSTLVTTESLRCGEFCECYYYELVCSRIPSSELLKDAKVLQVNGELKKISDQLKMPKLKIEKLNLSRCDITEIEPYAFSSLEQLSTLVLSYNRIEFIFEETFSNLSSLKHLFLDGNGIKVVMDGSLNLRNLQTVNLANNKLLEIPGNLPPSLRTLNLFNNTIERLPLERLNNLDELEYLNLCENEITTWTFGNYLSRVKNVCLGGRIIMSEGVYREETLLEELHISAEHLNSRYFDSTLKDTVSSFRHLLTLSIRNYEMTSFNFLKNLNNLRTLTLENIQLQGEGFSYFPPNLTKLAIIHSPDLARHILKYPGLFGNLKHLNLKNNGLEDILFTGVENGFEALESLDISWNPLNCSGNRFSWILEKLQTTRNFLNDSNNVQCFEPPLLRGYKVTEILTYETSRVKKYPRDLTEMNRTTDSTLTGNQRVEKSHLISGLILFIVFVICFLIIMTLCHKIILRLHKKYSKDTETQEQINGENNSTLQGNMPEQSSNSSNGDNTSPSMDKTQETYKLTEIKGKQI